MRCWAPRLSGRKVARQPKGRYGWLPAPRLGGDDGDMIRLSSFTPRMWLILVHDLLATAAAVLASFFIRFEEAGFGGRWRLLAVVLPVFVLYAGFVYAFSGLYKAKWRFTSLPDLYNIVRAATVLAVTLLALDYVLVAPNFYGAFFFGKITIVLYWLLQMRSWAARASPIAISASPARCSTPRPPIRRRSWCSAAPPMPRCCCARSRAGR